MKILVIFTAALLTVQAFRVPYIVQDSSEEEYHVLLPPNSAQGQLNLSGLGIINQPSLQAVKVKVPRYADPWLKKQLIQQYLAPYGLTLQEVGGQGPSVGAQGVSGSSLGGQEVNGQSLVGQGPNVQKVYGQGTRIGQSLGGQGVSGPGLGGQGVSGSSLGAQGLGVQSLVAQSVGPLNGGAQSAGAQGANVQGLGAQGIDIPIRSTQDQSTQGVNTQATLTQGVPTQGPSTQVLPTQSPNEQTLNQNSLYNQNSAAEDLLLQTLSLQNLNNQGWGFLNTYTPNTFSQTTDQRNNTLSNIGLRNRRQSVVGEQEENSVATPFKNKSDKEVAKVPSVGTSAPKLSDIPRLPTHRAVSVGLVKPSVVSSIARGGHETTTQKNCDIQCTKLQYNPVCAFNGECYHEFANQCVLETFICRRPELGFKATKNEECQRNWIKRCSEVQLKGV